MCPTPHDYRISTYIDRGDDYRGFNPLYRAGSVFGGLDGTHQALCNAYYEGDVGNLYSNAGNYGITTPVAMVRHSSGSGTFDTVPRIDRPDGDRINLPPRIREPNGTMPTLEELINQPRGTMPSPLPITPPGRPRTAPPSFENTDESPDTIPFSPSDDVIVPPNPFPSMPETGPPITLEELRRLDPSIQDVQIISIEDTDLGTIAL
jgi:hypothetical protein